MLFLLVARLRDIAVSTRKITEEAAQVGAGPEWEGQRKEESAESSKPGKVDRSFGALPILTRERLKEEQKSERSWESAKR